MKQLCRLMCIVITILFVLSCGFGQPAPKAKGTPEGRSETKVVEGASAAGYNGSQMRKKIDKSARPKRRAKQGNRKGRGTAPSK